MDCHLQMIELATSNVSHFAFCRAHQRVEKLDLCKKTLNLLLRELHHDDHFCLISFSDEAKVEVPMLKVCDDQKQRAMHTIEHMRVRGRTNVASALSLAAQVANGVKVSYLLRMLMLYSGSNEFSSALAPRIRTKSDLSSY